MFFDPNIVGIIGIILLLVLMFLRIPVGFTLIFIGFVGYFLISGFKPSMNVMGTTFYTKLSNQSLSAVPLFILMGYFTYYSGIVTEIFDTAIKWVGHTKGGVVQATILGGAGFGAISGSGMSSTATLSKITIPEMIRTGVDKKLAYGTVASIGPLASMIPPSILMIIVAIVIHQSIGKMLIGGLIPGLLAAAVYLVLVYILVKRNPNLAPPIQKVSLVERVKSLRNIWAFLLVVLLIMYGLYSGIFTPTEAGAVGAFIVLLMMLFKKGINFDLIRKSMLETIKTTCMIFLLVGGAHILSYFLAVTRIPSRLSDFLISLPVAPIIILLLIVLMYLIIGCLMDMVAAMFITLPIIFPAIVALGFDPIWFGVLLVFLAEVSMVTPPFGMSLFIIKSAVPDSDLKDIYQGSYPFIVADLVIIALLIMFPQIITFLPSIL